MNLHNAEFVRSVTAVADCPKDDLPQIAFAGKSNVGKSSVINKLLLRKNFARVGEAPGKTTHINFFRIDEAMYLVDLPGYGYAKVPQKEKERWGRLMEAYFAAPDTLTFGVMLVDARHAPTANDVVMANYFLQSGKPFVVVANKLDKLKKSEIAPNLARIREILQLPDAVVVPGEVLLHLVLCQLVAEVGVGRGLERVAVVALDLLIAVAEVEVFFAVGHLAGVDEGAVKPALVHDRKVWMHPSFLLIRGDRASCRRARTRGR